MPFSREACIEFLMQTDDASPLIQAMVYDTQYFRGDRIEGVVEQVKNS